METALENTLRRQGLPASELSEWAFSPNPSTGFIHISGNWNDETSVNIHVINATGQIVESVQVSDPASGQQTLQLGDLPNGLYLLRLECSKGQSTKQLVLQR